MGFPIAIAGAASFIDDVGGLLSGSKEPERLAENQQAYALALQGDANALAYLRQRTGQYGTAVVPGWNNNQPTGGWATASAKADAQSKYTLAKAKLDGMAAVTTAAEQFDQATGGQVSGAIIARQLEGYAPLLVIGAVVLLFVLSRKG